MFMTVENYTILLIKQKFDACNFIFLRFEKKDGIAG